MKNIDVQRYLKQFSDDADISIVIAHPKKRKVYEHEAVLLIADSEVPAFVIAIKRERGMDEEESAACKDGCWSCRHSARTCGFHTGTRRTA